MNVIPMPGTLPEALASKVNDQAVEVLEQALHDARNGKYQAVAIVLYGAEGDNLCRYRVRTAGELIQLLGLTRLLGRDMERDAP